MLDNQQIESNCSERGNMDRRVAKTRKLILNAFLKLLKEKGFEKITIQDIADEADINRGTVYLHFEDKYHLMDYYNTHHIKIL